MTTPQLVQRAFVVRLAQGESAADGAIPVIASSEAIDDYGEIVEQSTWRLDRFLRSPVALWQHCAWEDPIGYFKDVRVEGGALRATLVPYAGAADPEGRGAAVLARYQQGGPISVSVGFSPGRVDTEERNGQQVRVLRDCELYEISVVSIGANPEAVALRAAAARRLRERRTKGTPMTFTEYLAARGMSPEECASATGMSSDEITALMGGASPSPEQMSALGNGLGLSPEEVSVMFPKPEDKPVEGESKPEGKPEDKPVEGKGFEADALALLGLSSPAAALGRIASLLEGEGELRTLRARVTLMEDARRNERRTALLAAARADGRLPPAREAKLSGFLSKLSDPAALEEYLGTLEPALDLRERSFKPVNETSVVPLVPGITAEHIEAARLANEQRRAARAPR